MVSGKYSALSGAIAREQSIANISANLANVSTVGYKKNLLSFESMLRGEKQILDSKGINYNRVRKSFTDFSQGPLEETNNPLDLAIMGKGFFKIRGTEGDFLTRKGNFLIDSNGRLITDTGMAVLDDNGGEITIQNSDINKVVIDKTGTVYTVYPNGDSAVAARLAVVTVEDTSELERKLDTSFSIPQGVPEIPAEDYTVSQGSLEISNVNMTEEMARMIDDNRTFQAYHNMLKGYSRIGDKLDDLGSLA